MDEKQYYYLNLGSNHSYLELPKMDKHISSSVNYEVYSRAMINLGYHCRDDFDRFETNEEDLDSVVGALLGLMIVCIILAS